MRLLIHNLQLSLCTFAVLFTLSARSQTIVISELMPDNKNSLLDEDGDASDWIELHNLSDNTVSLNGWYLTDDVTDLTRWRLPDINIDAKGFLIVFASDKDRAIAGSELHTNFKLSASGEYIALVQADGSTVEDDFTFPALEEDISYGYGFSSSSLEPVVLMDATDPCTAHIPTDEIANWKENGFDDSGWLSGVTGVGYDENTTYQSLIGLDVMAMVDINPTVYMRVPFEVENSGRVASMLLKMKYDDAFVAYINGVKVAASPNAPATLTWNSGTTSIHDDDAAQIFEEYDISAHAGLLQEGDNILAIHGLNKGEDSSDLIFVPRLEVTLNDGDIDASTAGLLSSSTPGAANGLVQYADSVETPVTFPKRGFYDAPFTVAVSNVTLGATIRYTTDGSEPTETSTEYTGPISISSTVNFRVRAFVDGWKPSYPRTDTYIFVDDVAAKPKSSSSINGQALEYGMDQDVVSETYYDASNQVVTVQDALKAIPTISISTDDANLYDPSFGIYVNASQRWEVPASAELINSDGSKGFHINAGLRIRGGASRTAGNPKHSFRLFFRDDYGEGKLKFPLFEDEGVDEFKKVDLRSAQNYSWSKDNSTANTFLRDVFARDTTGEMGHEAYARSRYYHLYINGEYWGLFMTEERPVADFGESYLGGDSDDYDAIKVIGRSQAGQYSIEATDGTLDAYNRLYSAAMAGFTDNADYFSIMGLDANGEPDSTQEKLLDVDNMIDYLLVLYHMAASDNCITWFVGRYEKLNNMYAIYNRVNPDGFKWIHHDSEHSLDTYKALDFTGPFTHSNYTLPEYFNAMTLHDKLSVNEEYRIKFADRVYKHLYNDGALVRIKSEERLDYRAAQIDRAIVANAARWGSIDRDRDTWVNAVAATRAFFARAGDRCTEVIGYLDADGLIPSILPPRFDLNGGLVPSGTAISLAIQEAVSIAPSSPYNGLPLAVPGRFEAEDYDLGGSGIAYSDSNDDNSGGEYRPSEGVDVEVCGEGGYNVGWTEADEWMKYTVDVASAGDYEISIRVASPNDNAAFHIEVDDIDVTGSITVGNTSGYQNWADQSVSVGLAAGEQVIKLVVDNGGFNINYIEFTDLQTDFLPIEVPPGEEPVSEKTIYYTTDGTDPRAIGGGIAGSVYSGPVAITKPTHLKARCRTADGEWSALADATYWTPEIPLAVTELMYHAPDGNAGDFIEIKNISAETVTLKGYKLDNAVDFKFKNAAQTSLAPGEYVVAVDDIDSFSSTYATAGINIAGEFSGDFSNSGEKVDLEFRDNDLISFSYDDARNWPQAADGAGHSLVPIDAAVDDEESGSLDYGGNWRSSTYAGGSPGYADPDDFAAIVLNEITAHTDTLDPAPYDSNDEIELFNPTASAVILNDWYLSDNLENLSKWAIPDGTTIPANGFVVFDEDDFHPDRVSGFGLDKAGEQVILSASGHVVDAIRFKGQENGVSLGRYPDGANNWLTTRPTPAAPNEPVTISVWISEVMYNPLQPGNDFEYILLENTGNSPATLENDTGPYRIDGGVEFDFPAGTTLAAGEHLWVLSFNPTNTAKLALFCTAYGLNAANQNFIGGYSGSLSDRTERVALERPQASDDPENRLDISWVVVDELFYFDQSPWSSNADGTGYPLVRIGLSSWIAPSVDDVDGDLMADQWELDHFQSLDQPSADWDNDGYSNLEEYIANSDPTNAASRFSVEAYDATTLYWTAVPGRTYSVYWTADLSKAFVRIASGLTSGSYTDAVHAGTEDSNFYCIEVELD